jgi:HSP20 family protein
VDTSRLEASYEHGVLTITLPVAEQAQPRRIPVGGSSGKGAIEAKASG